MGFHSAFDEKWKATNLHTVFIFQGRTKMQFPLPTASFECDFGSAEVFLKSKRKFAIGFIQVTKTRLCGPVKIKLLGLTIIISFNGFYFFNRFLELQVSENRLLFFKPYTFFLAEMHLEHFARDLVYISG